MKNLLISFPIVPLSVLAMCWTLFRMFRYPEDRLRNDRLCAAMCCALPGTLIAQLLTAWLSSIRPNKLDLYAYWIDGRLGFQPSFLLGQLFQKLPATFTYALQIAYSLMPLAMAVTFAIYVLHEKDGDARRVARTFILCFIVIIPLYCLFPICGPQFAFPEFPKLPTGVTTHSMRIDAPPNGMPSGHFSVSLLVLIFLRRWRLGFLAAGTGVVAMLLATLASGQHYLIDLVMAIPYTWLIYRLGFYEWRRKASSSRSNDPAPLQTPLPSRSH